MTAFYVAAAALVAATLAMLSRPWWGTSRRTASADSQATLNVAIHRDRLAELERDHQAGTLSATDLVVAREELQAQLLEDVGAEDATDRTMTGRRDVVILAVAVALLSVGLYGILGNPSAMLPEGARARQATADMENLTARLAQKLEQSPDNPEGWAMLARSYKSMERWDEADRAFGRIGPSLEQNAELLAEYAEMLVQRDNGFGPQARELTRKALQREPRNMLALFLGGGEAFESGRYAEAASLWQRLLPLLDPGSEDALMVEASIRRARERGGSPAPGPIPQDEVHGAKSPGPASAASSGSGTPASKVSVSGRVELLPALKGQASPDDTIFIFARAIEGPRMPLAVYRSKAASLPIDFVLDDSQALSPETRLSSVARLRIEVRLSKSGNAAPGKGDLTGQSNAVKPGAKGIRILIDKVEQ